MSRITAPPVLEALEPRIAPAVILAGPTAFGGQDYDDPGTPFQSASSAPISGTSLDFSSSHFYLDLKSGDTLKIYNDSSAFTDAITVTGGRAYAFFFDKNGDLVPQANELTGLVVSEKAKLIVTGTVDGDILATLNSKTGVFSTESLISINQTITELTIGGDVNGSIVAGGSLAKITVGNVNEVRSGASVAFSYDFGGTDAAPGVGEGTIGIFDPGVKKAGGSLTNIRVGSADGIFAGDGGAGGMGGSITGLNVVADADGIVVSAGNGGDGALKATSGGIGGKVSQVVFAGVQDSTANDLIVVRGGAGGDALAGTTGKGGNGGLAEKIWIGYQYDASQHIVESPNFLQDEILIGGGNGGDGATAGSGGNVSNVYLVSAPLEDGGASEIAVLGGNAGDITPAGKKAGAGGSISLLGIKNVDTSLIPSDVFVKAGDASAWDLPVPATGTAAVGGSITNPVPKPGEVWFVGKSFSFQAGFGSSTAAGGGAGGSVSNLQFDNSPAIVLEDLGVIAGDGGASLTGAGGKGGSIFGVYAPLAALNGLVLTAGDGGDSLGVGLKGKAGGAGGNLGSVQIFDTEGTSIVGVVGLAGAGGMGISGGGAGGSVNGFSFFGEYASLSLMAGPGGSVTGAKGAGGLGGSILNVAFNSGSASTPEIQTAALAAGAGGNGPSSGGEGGSVAQANIQVMGAVSLTGGAGGSAGEKGKIGAGGTVGSTNAAQGVFVKSQTSNVFFTAGDAGGVLVGTPKSGAAGGSIANVVASAARDISFDAGEGSIGGNGGDIIKIAFYGESGADDVLSGALTVAAGNGGDAISARSAAGRGGSVTTATGYSSSLDVGLYNSTAIDSLGRQHVAYYDASRGDLKYALYDGGSWSITTLDAEGDVGQYTSLVLTSGNQPFISYYDATNGDLKLAEFDGAVWDIQTVADAGDVGLYSAIQLDAADQPAIAYYDLSETDFQFARFDGSWSFSTIDNAGNVGKDASLAYDPSLDIFHAAYSRQINAVFGVMEYAQSVDGGLSWSVFTPGFFPSGLHTSIAVNSVGNVGVSYTDTAGTLNYLEMTPDGNLLDLSVVDNNVGVNVAQATSLSFDELDNPRIAYGSFRGGGSELRYAVSEAGTWSYETATSESGSGGYAAMALDADGNPHIVYHNSKTFSLNLVQNMGIWSQPVEVDGASVGSSIVFTAGDGGNGGKAGAGGSFTGLTIYGGLTEFSVIAGNGGNGPASGGAGGSASNINVLSDLVVRAIAAGDGGDGESGKAKGASGGSVSGVNVNGDVGTLTGKSYGFSADGSLMGGIFAGQAGVNTASPLDMKLAGKSGDVTNVTAQAIAAIVAGRDASPQLVNRVDGIFLRGNTAPTVDADGAFTNFSSANLVGGKAGDPGLPDADDFHFAGGSTFSPTGFFFSPWTQGVTEPLDGLVAALTLGANRNFTPLAFLTNVAADPKAPPVFGLYVTPVAAA